MRYSLPSLIDELRNRALNLGFVNKRVEIIKLLIFTLALVIELILFTFTTKSHQVGFDKTIQVTI
jgi:hypothetical protein